MKFLDADQVEHFLTRGYGRIPACFDRQLAEEWRALAFERLGYDENDPQTWKDARVHLPSMNRIDVSDFAPDAWAAICDLMGGPERIRQPINWGDGFIVNFNQGADQPWQAPSAEAGGWHKDGDWFRHFLDGPEQGLLTIVVWSDILPQSGGTFIAADSIGPIARYQVEHPEGLHPEEAAFGERIHECSQFEELTGEAGDVVFMREFT